jgi:transposase
MKVCLANLDTTSNLHIRCVCNEELILELKRWQFNIMGVLQFRCPKCGYVTDISLNAFWRNNVAKDSEERQISEVIETQNGETR